jgi:hypothetical protein
MSPSIIIASILASGFVALAQAADDAAAAPEPIGSYQLKNRSTFSTPDNARPPFWPVGHVKSAPGVVQVTAGARVGYSPEMFSLTSVVVGNPSLAIINGRAYGEGESIRLGARAPGARTAAADTRQRIRVNRILDGQVVLQAPDGQILNVSLRRPELPDRKPDQESEVLSNDDR